MALTKTQIVDTIHEEFGFPRNRCAELLESLLEIIKKSLEDGSDVMISGFGKFCIHNKRQRKGRNPATGESLMLDKRRVVTFKCAQKLRDEINKN